MLTYVRRTRNLRYLSNLDKPHIHESIHNSVTAIIGFGHGEPRFAKVASRFIPVL